jgi:hypothetical protein
VLSCYLSLVFARLARERLRDHGLIVLKFVDVCAFHVLVLYVLVIWLELPLNLFHFSLNFKFLLYLQLCFQMLTHVSRVLTLQYLLIHVVCLSLKCLDIRVISFLVYSSHYLIVIQLINLDLSWHMTCSSTQFVGVPIQVIIERGKLHSVMIFGNS